ncbi:hypothetical protein SKAU_G00101120 [Synaphobranchus kaupii]|uniref:Uncharacterized protein n=1 Tax=Synaphobranchus kaupii TaxID=118154 RepID=A0A9Q1J746_SYNKA|nr:hypothetical protein SKAU_G00101120 [Synaphobranchus kaupii]
MKQNRPKVTNVPCLVVQSAHPKETARVGPCSPFVVSKLLTAVAVIGSAHFPAWVLHYKNPPKQEPKPATNNPPPRPHSCVSITTAEK